MEERVGRGSRLGGRAVLLHLAENTLSIMESEILWQVREAVSSPALPTTYAGSPPAFICVSTGVTGRTASAPAAACRCLLSWCSWTIRMIS